MIGAMRAGWDDVRGIEIDRHYVEIAKKDSVLEGERLKANNHAMSTLRKTHL